MVRRRRSSPSPTSEPPPSPPGVEADDRQTPGGPWSRPFRPLTAGLLLTIGAAAFEALTVATILPAVVKDLGGLRAYGWVFSAFMLASLIGIALAGGEADRHGPARPFAVGVGLFVVGLLIGGASPSMPVLIAGRAVQGFGSGAIGAVAYVVIGRGYPDAAKPRMLALLSSAWVVPGLVGPALAGVVADGVGWRWVFLGLTPLLLIASVLALPALHRIPGGSATERDRRRIARAVQLAAGTGLLLVGLGAADFRLAVPVAIAGAALGWPALRALTPAGTVRAAPGLPAAIATMGLLTLSFFGADAFVPLALTELRGRSNTFAGVALTAATITWTTGSWVQARYARRIGRVVLVRSGLVLVGLGIAGVALTLSPAVSVILAPIAWGVAGLGMGLAFATISMVVLETAPVGQEGAATSSMSLANTLGIAVGAGIGGVLVAASGTADRPSRSGLLTHDLLMIGVVAVAVAVAGRLPRRPPPLAEPAVADTRM